jgi:hypothetical protein
MSPDGTELATAPDDEQWSRVRALLTEVSGEQKIVGRLTDSVLRAQEEPPSPGPVQSAELVVVASGNLGMAYYISPGNPAA